MLEDNYRLLFITIKDNEIGSSTENIDKVLSTVEFCDKPERYEI